MESNHFDQVLELFFTKAVCDGACRSIDECTEILDLRNLKDNSKLYLSKNYTLLLRLTETMLAKARLDVHTMLQFSLMLIEFGKRVEAQKKENVKAPVKEIIKSPLKVFEDVQ